MKLCINADDFLASTEIDNGILQAIDDGLVNSVSALVDGEDIQSATKLPADGPVCVGLHLSLTSLANRQLPNYKGPISLLKVWLLGHLPHSEVQNEFEHQYQRFGDLFGRPPTHLDCHQHIHALPPIRKAASKLATDHGLRLRVPYDKTVQFSIKAWLLRLAFSKQAGQLRETYHGFTGLALMGRGFRQKAVRQQLESMVERGCRQVEWMVHVGHESTNLNVPSHNSAGRSQELRELLALKPYLTENYELACQPQNEECNVEPIFTRSSYQHHG